MVSLRYPPVWDATAASCNTTMVLVTQKTSTQPRAFDELFDIVHRFDTLSPENPKLHCEVPVGINLDKLHQFPDRLLLRIFIVMSQSRRSVCSPFGA